MRSIFLCKNCSIKLFGEKGEAHARKSQNLQCDLDLWPCDLDQGQRSRGPMVKTPSHYLLPFLSFTHICDVSNNQGEITPIRSDQIPSTEM